MTEVKKVVKKAVKQPATKMLTMRDVATYVKTDNKIVNERIKKNVSEINARIRANETNVTGRFTTVNNAIQQLDKAFDNRAKKALEKQVTRLEKLNNLVKLDERIHGMEEKLSYIDERLRLMIHKETVLTEVSRLARGKGDYVHMAQFHLAIMKAYNQDDAWWGLNEHELLIGEWYDKIINLLGE